jgi:Ni,Fe-hydrogenase III large subunit
VNGGEGRLVPGRAAAIATVPRLGLREFRDEILAAVKAGRRVAALFGRPAPAGRVELIAVLAEASAGTLSAVRCEVADRYPSLTPECAQVHLFEREIAEQWGVVPEGHPWLKPVRSHAPYWIAKGPVPWEPLFRMAGAGIHEVAVGPVHAGIIEPGHFRFQCEGEIVHHLEIVLGYQHRGIERALRGGPDRRTIPYLETVAGDTTVGHTIAYAQGVEALSGTAVTDRAEALRGVALELERCANHTGDLGAMAGDVGFLPTAAYCGRLRGEILNLTALVCGNRLGRGWIRPGGCGFDLDPSRLDALVARLEAAVPDVGRAFHLARNASTVRARFEETGVLTPDVCVSLGIVGPPARAAGIARDARAEFPFGAYRLWSVPVASWTTGDVMGRARVRWLEIQRAAAFIKSSLGAIPDGPIRVETGPLAPESVAVSIVEGWRGEIVHVAMTDAAGKFARYKIVDPSFRNWAGLAWALRGQAISDFPLCNKSFNLSYCGHDL